jgi:hypothetical protein
MSSQMLLTTVRARRIARRVAVAIALTWPTLGAAQTINPGAIEFKPPPNHTDVTRYDVAFYKTGAADPFLVVNAGKPQPQADGLIRLEITRFFTVWPQPNTVCDARVIAVPPSGPAVSLPSNSFIYQCGFTLSATGKSFDAAAASSSVSVTAQSYCAWTATSSASWISLTGATGGAGSGTIAYAVAANTTTSSRSGSLTIANVTYTVTQAAAAVAPTPTSPPPTSPPANIAPTVTITRPSNGDTVTGRQMKLDATASDPDGSIAQVEFYVNGIRVGTATKAPYSVQWPATAGTHTVKALATDNVGASTWSAPVTASAR